MVKREVYKKGKGVKKRRAKVDVIKIALLILIAIMMVPSCLFIQDAIHVRKESNEIKAQKKKLQETREDLKDELKNVNDRQYIEEQARIQLNMTKPGEILYIFSDSAEEDNGKDEYIE